MTFFECRPPAATLLDAVRTGVGPGEALLDDERRPESALAAPRITALAEMTAGLAHDFRNLLAVIESGLTLAERHRDDPVKARAALAAARDGIRRGIRLTSRLVRLGRGGKADLRPENVNDLLEALQSFAGYGIGPDIRIVLDLAPDLPRCRVDPSQFSSAVLNLVINARDAMPDGGEIRIETDAGEGNSEDVAAARRFVRVRIIDRGCGMSPEVAQHLFDPYFTTKGDAGTGLGVPQVAAFMRASGGSLCVTTEPGVGTAVDLYFPVADHRAPVRGDLWRQLDRWVNEGGRPEPDFSGTRSGTAPSIGGGISGPAGSRPADCPGRAKEHHHG